MLQRVVGPIQRVWVWVMHAVLFTVGACFCIPTIVKNIMQTSVREATAFASLWETCSSAPCGVHFLSGLCGILSPYTGSISPRIVAMSPSEVVVSIEDYPWLRNPFRSLHAIALSNLGELASALALLMFQQATPGSRVILVSLSAEFHAKARGTISASVADLNIPDAPGNHLVPVTIPLTNATGTEVATIVATWRVSINPTRRPKGD